MGTHTLRVVVTIKQLSDITLDRLHYCLAIQTDSLWSDYSYQIQESWYNQLYPYWDIATLAVSSLAKAVQ